MVSSVDKDPNAESVQGDYAGAGEWQWRGGELVAVFQTTDRAQRFGKAAEIALSESTIRMILDAAPRERGHPDYERDEGQERDIRLMADMLRKRRPRRPTSDAHEEYGFN